MWGVLSIALFFLPFNRWVAWIILFIATAMGVHHHIITPLGVAIIAIFALIAALWPRYSHSRIVAVCLELLLVASSVALILHLLPGFNNALIISKEKIGPLSSPFSLYYNFDKALIPFLLFICLPTLFKAKNRIKQTDYKKWLLLAASIPALLLIANALGGIKFELHMPPWILAFIMSNIFFVSMAEEALFRGYLQQRLEAWLGIYPALIISALLFGLLHLSAGPMMVIFACLAGIIYGLAWIWSRRLWVAILFHFALNLIHLLFFTYPMYQHP